MIMQFLRAQVMLFYCLHSDLAIFAWLVGVLSRTLVGRMGRDRPPLFRPVPGFSNTHFAHSSVTCLTFASKWSSWSSDVTRVRSLGKRASLLYIKSKQVHLGTLGGLMVGKQNVGDKLVPIIYVQIDKLLKLWFWFRYSSEPLNQWAAQGDPWADYKTHVFGQRQFLQDTHGGESSCIGKLHA